MKNRFHQFVRSLNLIPDYSFQNLGWLICSDKISFGELPYHLIFDFEHQNEPQNFFNWYIETLEQKTFERDIESLPLGKYAEKLIEYYLANHPSYHLHASNLQLIKNKKTIGELDFLFDQFSDKQSYHLEFTLKYYLKTKLNGKSIFLGHGAKDQLSRKAGRLVRYQSKALRDNRSLLPKPLQAIYFKPKILMKGCLFYPYDEWNNKSRFNPFNQAWWLNFNDINKINASNYTYSLIDSRLDWIFPFKTYIEKFSFKDLNYKCEELLSFLNEVMIVRWDEHERVIDRGFVMKKGWPHIDIS